MNTIIDCFKKLNKESIRYCHFKSNAHLDKSIAGKTDFDILVSPDNAYIFQRILLDFGFKKRYSTFNKNYIGMEDYLFYDVNSGKIHHFHVHYRLIFGAKYNKVYSYPDIEKLLDNTQVHPEYHINILMAELELVLLIVRIFLKTNFFNRQGVKNTLIKNIPISSNIIDEIEWLLLFCDFGEVEKNAQKIFPEISSLIIRFIDLFKADNLSRQFLFFSKLRVIKAIKRFQKISNKQRRFDVTTRKNYLKYSRSWLVNGGVIIGIIGADGSGKSTISKELVKWLSYKLSADTIYLGRIKKDPLLHYLKFCSLVFHKIKIKFLYRLIQSLCHVYVAYQRYRIFIKAKYSAGSGCIIVSDRFPLKEFWNMQEPMDGPRVTSEFPWLRSKERAIYKNIESLPDIMIVLQVSTKDSIARKPEHSNILIKQNVEKKIEAVNMLVEKIKHKNVHFIDTSVGLDQVNKSVKEIIWNSI